MVFYNSLYYKDYLARLAHEQDNLLLAMPVNFSKSFTFAGLLCDFIRSLDYVQFDK